MAEVKVNIPAIKLPNVIDPKTDEIAVVEAIPKFAKLLSELPTIPQKALDIFPGELPIDKWMERFNEMVEDTKKALKDLVEKQVEEIKKKNKLEERLAKEGANGAN